MYYCNYVYVLYSFTVVFLSLLLHCTITVQPLAARFNKPYNRYNYSINKLWVMWREACIRTFCHIVTFCLLC